MYIEDKKIVENKPLIEFLENYFNEGCPATYNDINCSVDELNCSAGKRRSISDLLDIYKTYNKSEETLEDVIRCLPKLKCTYSEEDMCEGSIINIRYCGTPKKIVVFVKEEGIFSNYVFKNTIISILDEKYSETGTDDNHKGLDGLSINYVKKVLGIKR